MAILSFNAEFSWHRALVLAGLLSLLAGRGVAAGAEAISEDGSADEEQTEEAGPWESLIEQGAQPRPWRMPAGAADGLVGLRVTGSFEVPPLDWGVMDAWSFQPVLPGYEYRLTQSFFYPRSSGSPCRGWYEPRPPEERLFFGLETSDRPAVYVIDYSGMMSESYRREVIEEELERTLNHLGEGTPYQVILYAGYAWVPGDKVVLAPDKMSATVTDGERVYQWLRPSRSTFDWVTVDGDNRHFIREVPWQLASPGSIAKTMAAIRGYKLQINSNCEIPLEMAMSMKPAPRAVYFVTNTLDGMDGAAGFVDRLGRKSQGRIPINAVAYFETEEIATLRDLAHRTAGGFSVVTLDGVPKPIFPEWREGR